MAFILISILTALYTANYYQEKEEVAILSTQLDEIEILLLRAFKEQENYFNFETSNEDYFLSHESDFIDGYQHNHQLLKRKITQLRGQSILNKSALNKLQNITHQLSKFDSLFVQMQASINKRGFKNFGLEGEMREAIHELEDMPEIPLEDILMLRRHEKDYILRQEADYLEKHTQLIGHILTELSTQDFEDENRKQEIQLKLQNYAHLFSQVALYERIIGLKANSGFKKKLDQKIGLLSQDLENLKQESLDLQASLMQYLNYSIIAFWAIYLLVSIWLSTLLSKRFTKRISELSGQINYFVNTNFTARMNTALVNSNDEVGALWNNFKKMENEIVEYIELFKEKVDEKTMELMVINQEIESQKEALEVQKIETDQKNKDLVDGMKYGWRIQQALLPDLKRLNKQIEKGFVLFSPKDVVSGDVYWTHRIHTKNGVENIFSVVDCTGHGVPGAFMSILALNAIEDATIAKKHRRPSFIVQSANDYVFSSMKYYKNESRENLTKDGMDMALCKLNRSKLELQYCGASRPLYLVREKNGTKTDSIGLSENEYALKDFEAHYLFEIYPNKDTVGTIGEAEGEYFKGKTIQLQQNDMLYLSSDGYADQFGGPKDKKFLTKRFKKLLAEIFALEVAEQKEVLQTRFLDWKGDREQIDDVCVMGVRV